MSNRVVDAGMFHPAKVQYSPETRQFLKDLISECKMTTMQRQKVNYNLRSGDPLPVLSRRSESRNSPNEKVTIRPRSSKRRSFSSILDSGAYERDKYVPFQPRVNREAAKQYLQDHMAYGKSMANVYKPKPEPKEEKVEINRFDELKQEIQDRVEWLAEMNKLGEGYKHKMVIEQQIAARIREMKKLNPEHGTEKNVVRNK